MTARSTSADPRERVLALLRSHGEATTAFQVLEPGLEYLFHGAEGDLGCTAYVDTGAAWVAAGPPIAAGARRAELARAFVEAAHARGRRACLFAVDRALAERAGLEAIAIGEDPEWDPAEWPALLASHRKLREQLRRARAKGVRVRLVGAAELREGSPLRREVDALIVRWLAGRPLAAMGFLVDVRPFEFPEEHIYAIAERGDRLVAFLAAVPIHARRGWFVEDLLREPDAPNGTAELLLDRVFREAHARGARHMTLGLAPLSGDVHPALRAIAHWSRGLYGFDGVRAFKARLHPRAWSPVFLAFPSRARVLGLPIPRPLRWVFATHDALRAFATGGFLRFGIRSLKKQRRAVVLVLGALLLPWTLHVARPEAAPWIPTPLARVGWIAFHLLVALALIGLFRRWRRAIATVLASTSALDAAITIVEVARHVGASASPAVITTAMASILAPAIAAAFLWYARRLPLEAAGG